MMTYIGLGTTVVAGVIAYVVAKKMKQRNSENTSLPHRKHSHIRKAKHAHEPNFMA